MIHCTRAAAAAVTSWWGVCVYLHRSDLLGTYKRFHLEVREAAPDFNSR